MSAAEITLIIASAALLIYSFVLACKTVRLQKQMASTLHSMRANARERIAQSEKKNQAEVQAEVKGQTEENGQKPPEENGRKSRREAIDQAELESFIESLEKALEKGIDVDDSNKNTLNLSTISNLNEQSNVIPMEKYSNRVAS